MFRTFCNAITLSFVVVLVGACDALEEAQVQECDDDRSDVDCLATEERDGEEFVAEAFSSRDGEYDLLASDVEDLDAEAITASELLFDQLREELGLEGAQADASAVGSALASPLPEPAAGLASNSVCTSWSIHCTKISMSNCAGMYNSKGVLICGEAHHTNDHVDFYYTRAEHHIHSYDDKTYYATIKCPTNYGDWATKYARTCNIAYSGHSGYTVHSRLCFDIKDDGKGELCTSYAVAKAVW